MAKNNFFFNFRAIILPVLGLLLILVALILFFSSSNISKIRDGAVVKVDYSGWLDDGAYFDTTIEDIANEKGIYDENKEYKPFVFEVGAKDVIQGFEETVKTMKVGEEREVRIPPEKGYGKRDPRLILSPLPKEIKLKRRIELSADEFKKLFGKEPVANMQIKGFGFDWWLTVMSIFDNKVIIYHELKKGDKIILPGAGWKSDVVDIDDDFLIILQNPQRGDKILLPSKENLIQAEVLRVTDKEYYLDANFPLVGKTLNFKIKLLEIVEK